MSPPGNLRSLPLLAAQGTTGDPVRSTLDGSTSKDMIFAVVGHVGAGASWVASSLAEGLRSHSYDPVIIKMSELITTACANSARVERRLERTQRLQDAGNELRKRHGTMFVAALAIRQIYEDRREQEQRGVSESRRAYILDSLKNPDEIDALRKVYGSAVYVICVVCGAERREARLRVKYKGETSVAIKAVMDRDMAEQGDFGQQVRKTLQAGDLFVNNEEEEHSSTKEPAVAGALKRFLQIVFATDVVRPTSDERGMHAAWSAGLRSSCMSRQVGAAILSREGQIIAVGTNDVPKYGGGLYEERSAQAGADHRCFHYPRPAEDEKQGFCRNDRAKDEILKKAVEQFQASKVLREGVNEADVIAALRKTPISDLIEFSRAVHAEMDAIVTIARATGPSTTGGTLYCTTYPCHSCARHIVAAGLRDVVYIEPYTKSRAASLHDDAIVEGTEAPDENATRVVFRLFTGVAPRRFSALFEKRGELKRNGRLNLSVESDSRPTDPLFTKSHLQFEASIATQVQAVMEAQS